MELLFRNCSVIDGTNAPAFLGSVGFDKGKLRVFRGENETLPPAQKVVDARGYTLVPGMIDAHSHGDLMSASAYAERAKLSQGFTTQIAGQCGISMFPCADTRAADFTRFVTGYAPHPDLPSDVTILKSAKDYFQWLASLGTRVNTKTFVGHGALRLAVMGYANRAPDAGELLAMQKLLRQCMREGAIGLSVGLVYAPSEYAKNDELLALLRVVSEEGGFFACHPRSEADFVEEARRESLLLAKEAGVPLCMSHMKAAGRQNWGKPHAILAEAERFANDGTPVLMDVYPYYAGCTSLNISIPPRYFSRGVSSLVEALADPHERAVIREEMSHPSNYENFVIHCGGFGGVLVSSCPVMHDAEGIYVSEYAEKKGIDPYDAYFDILLQNGGYGIGTYFHTNPDDTLEILRHPLCVVGTDGLLGAETETPHPRCFGSTARAYRLLVKEKQVCSPETVFHKLSGQTADFFGLNNKGVIESGRDADAVLLDLNEFCDTATYQNGNSPSRGVIGVYVGGERVYGAGLEDA